MRAKCLPSGEHSPAMPSGEPLGLKGYCWVISWSALQYLHTKSRPDLGIEKQHMTSGYSGQAEISP